MITILQHPSNICTAGNPIEFIVRGDRYIQSSGKRALQQLRFQIEGNTFSFGDEFILIVNNVPVKYTVRRAIVWEDPTSLQGGDTIDKLFILLQSNIDITDNYDISLLSEKIYFTAKKIGSEWNIVLSQKSKTLGITSIDVGMNVEFQKNYRILQQVISNGEIIGLPDYLVPGVDASAYNDISEYLQEMLVSEFEYPVSTPYIHRPKGVIPFSCRYTEVINDMPLFPLKTDTYNVIGGFLSDLEFNVLKKSNENFENIITYVFLTKHPKVKKIFFDQPEKLFFIFREVGTYRLRTTIRYSDQTSSTRTICTLALEQQTQMVEFNVGLKFLGQDPVKIVNSYDVWIEKVNVLYSEIRTFNVEYSKPYFSRYFFFKNSFGVCDCVCLFGEKQINYEYERDNVQSYDDQSSFNVIKIKEVEKITISSGYLDNKEIYNWLRDFQRSDNIFELIDTSLFRLVLINTKSKELSDNNTLYSHEFEYKYTFAEYNKRIPRRHTSQFTNQFD